MKTKNVSFLGFVFAVVGAVLAASGCDDGTIDEVRTPIAGLPDGVTGEAIKRVVPEALTIIKANASTVWVGVEIPKGNDPDTGIEVQTSAGLSGFTTLTDKGADWYDSSDDKTYWGGSVTSAGEVSITFVSEHNKIVDVSSGTSTTVSDDVTATKKVYLDVKSSDFKAQAANWTIPNVTAADYKVYSGKAGDANGTYVPFDVSNLGWNDREILVNLPDYGAVNYLKYRYSFADGKDGPTVYGYHTSHATSDEGGYVQDDWYDGFDYISGSGALSGRVALIIRPQARYRVTGVTSTIKQYTGATTAVSGLVGKYNTAASRAAAVGASKTIGGYTFSGNGNSGVTTYYTYSSSNGVTTYTLLWQKNVPVTSPGTGGDTNMDGVVYVELDGTTVHDNTGAYAYLSTLTFGDGYVPYVTYTDNISGTKATYIPVSYDTVIELPTTVQLKFATAADGNTETASATAETVTLTGYTGTTSGFNVVR